MTRGGKAVNAKDALAVLSYGKAVKATRSGSSPTGRTRTPRSTGSASSSRAGSARSRWTRERSALAGIGAAPGDRDRAGLALRAGAAAGAPATRPSRPPRRGSRRAPSAPRRTTAADRARRARRPRPRGGRPEEAAIFEGAGPARPEPVASSTTRSCGGGRLTPRPPWRPPRRRGGGARRDRRRAPRGPGRRRPRRRGADRPDPPRRALDLPGRRSIAVADDLPPSVTAEIPAGLLLGIALSGGSPTAHACILARSLGIPAVVATVGLLDGDRRGDRGPPRSGRGAVVLAIDGSTGEVVVDPARPSAPGVAARAAELEARRAQRAAGRGPPRGDRRRPARAPRREHREARRRPAGARAGAEGVGLFRTEFVFMRARSAADRGRAGGRVPPRLRGVRARPPGGHPARRHRGRQGDPVPPARARSEPVPRRARDPARAHGDPDLLRTQLRAIWRAGGRAGVVPHVMAPMVATRRGRGPFSRRCATRRGLPSSRRGSLRRATWSDRDHGRGAGRDAPGAGARPARRVLQHRDERPHPVRHGRRPGQRDARPGSRTRSTRPCSAPIAGDRRGGRCARDPRRRLRRARPATRSARSSSSGWASTSSRPTRARSTRCGRRSPRARRRSWRRWRPPPSQRATHVAVRRGRGAACSRRSCREVGEGLGGAATPPILPPMDAVELLRAVALVVAGLLHRRDPVGRRRGSARRWPRSPLARQRPDRRGERACAPSGRRLALVSGPPRHAQGDRGVLLARAPRGRRRGRGAGRRWRPSSATASRRTCGFTGGRGVAPGFGAGLVFAPLAARDHPRGLSSPSSPSGATRRSPRSSARCRRHRLRRPVLATGLPTALLASPSARPSSSGSSTSTTSRRLMRGRGAQVRRQVTPRAGRPARPGAAGPARHAVPWSARGLPAVDFRRGGAQPPGSTLAVPAPAARPGGTRHDDPRRAPREDPRDPGLPEAGHPLLRHHDAPQGPVGLPRGDRRDARAVRRRRRWTSSSGWSRGASSSARRWPTSSAPGSSRSASSASCRPRPSASSTPWSTGRTRSRVHRDAIRARPEGPHRRRPPRHGRHRPRDGRARASASGARSSASRSSSSSSFLKGRDRLAEHAVSAVIRY